MARARIVVDRVEGDVAVLEIAGKTIDVPVSVLPEGAGEGAVLTLALSTSTTADASAADRLARMASQSAVSDDFTF